MKSLLYITLYVGVLLLIVELIEPDPSLGGWEVDHPRTYYVKLPDGREVKILSSNQYWSTTRLVENVPTHR